MILRVAFLIIYLPIGFVIGAFAISIYTLIEGRPGTYVATWREVLQ